MKTAQRLFSAVRSYNTVFMISALLLTTLNCSPGFGRLEHSLNDTRGDIGPYTYRVDQNRFIVNRDNTEVVSFDLNGAFIRAERAEPLVEYHMAAFDIDQKVLSECDEQNIDNINEMKGSLVISGRLSGDGCMTGYRLTLEPVDNSLALRVTLNNKKINRLYLKTGASENEAVFGGGEQFTHLNLKGHEVFMLSEEQGIGRGAQPITTGADLTAGAGGNEFTTYTPVPFFLTSENRAFFAENTEYMKFNFKDEYTEMQFWSGQISMKFYTGRPSSLLRDFTAHTGRMLPLPDWAYGTILGMQGGRDKVEKAIQQSVDAGNPVTAIWIQDWVGRRKTSFGSQLWWRWLPDEESYPDFKNWVADLDRRGIRTMGYINPFLADSGPMYEEAVENDYLVKNKAGEDYIIETAGFPAVMLDLTNPETRRWIKSIIKKHLIGNGLAGWMADFGEWLPFDAVLHSGESAAAYHNRYPVEWAQLNREAIQEAGLEGEVVFFTRAGFSYSARYSTLFWEGDQMVTFDEYDGLASAVTGLLSSGLSGISLNHSDIGGYTTINNPLKDYHRSEELFYRWAEKSAFTPVYRTHEGNRPEENFQFYSTEKGSRFFARMGRIHRAMTGYFKALADEAYETGLPVIRAAWLVAPDEPATRNLRHQFHVGNDMIVLPVLEEGETSVSGYLTEGSWLHLWSGRIYEGRKSHTVKAEIGKPAVFLRNIPEMKEMRSDILKASE